MSEGGELDKRNNNTPTVVRSEVPEREDYRDYKPALRSDFVYSCAYCTIAESEATAHRFTIDHYEPVVARPDLETKYQNLMYCCDSCNSRKGDRSPPDDQREKGYRFFRADSDIRGDHFRLSGRRLAELSPTGKYTILALSLNRDELLRLRAIREKIAQCDEFIADGIAALKAYPIDTLPAGIRSKANATINLMGDLENKLAEDLDNLLANYARSPLDGGLGSGESAQERAERLEKLKRIEGLSPGAWRGRKKR